MWIELVVAVQVIDCHHFSRTRHRRLIEQMSLWWAQHPNLLKESRDLAFSHHCVRLHIAPHVNVDVAKLLEPVVLLAPQSFHHPTFAHCKNLDHDTLLLEVILCGESETKFACIINAKVYHLALRLRRSITIHTVERREAPTHPRSSSSSSSSSSTRACGHDSGCCSCRSSHRRCPYGAARK